MNIDKFYFVVSKLKNIKRSGWIERGVSNPETVSSHSFMSSLLSLILVPKGIDKEKVIKMMIVHGIAESLTGDLITKENWAEGGTTTKIEKSRLERKAMDEILSNLDDDIRNEILSLWEEFDKDKTPESQFVNDMDTFEMTLQAMDYHNNGNFKKPLKSFWRSENIERIRNKRLKSILSDIIESKGW